jgi:probable blue pigment (indigoidine) exporter
LLTFTAWQLVAGGLVLLPSALAVEGLPPSLSVSNLFGYLWLGSAGTAVAYALWFRGIEKLPVGRVSLLALLSPIVATSAGWLVLHQRLTGAQMAGATLVLGAIWLGQLNHGPTGAGATSRTRRFLSRHRGHRPSGASGS